MAGWQVGRIYGRTIQYQTVSFPGDTGESVFQVRHGESLKKFFMVDVGFDPTTRNKPMVCRRRHFVEVLVGYLY